MKRVIVAMSGGVDSSVSAVLLKQMGFDVVGVSLLLYDTKAKSHGRTCCTIYDLSDAERVARKIRIPFYILDMREEFRKFVIENFISEYRNARTPIPCVHCNNYIKFDILLKKAEEISADYIATGHYAVKIKENGNYYVSKAPDHQKDQSYFLFGLTSEKLKKIIFPVGKLLKSQVRKIAEELNLPVADKKDSQDICFTEGKEIKDVLKGFGLDERIGKIKDEKGNVVGHHSGYYFLTVGQRRGLGVRLGKPMYVIDINKDKNEIVVGEKHRLLTKNFCVENLTFANKDIEERAKNGIECIIKVRYSHQGSSGRIISNGKRTYVEFHEEYGPVVPGQACVFYENEKIIGGGFISDKKLWGQTREEFSFVRI
ncbi:MAG: tRNA 2-thiouridine(34) synthase MnmA [Candidatus Calescibacterium sp.]|nr:tRNA 2-thiouridine(34) synthase MnmA [Candidatus Calescibacterium sp.]MCX7733761.1 tRNA 2-thiouridine(34) synthase MnmA [bacterium]MDW8086675.1 tRNA 2-thiouridine(34) synthase MnmA [Candidatus Calescibacterium sp.]